MRNDRSTSDGVDLAAAAKTDPAVVVVDTDGVVAVAIVVIVAVEVVAVVVAATLVVAATVAIDVVGFVVGDDESTG